MTFNMAKSFEPENPRFPGFWSNSVETTGESELGNLNIVTEKSLLSRLSTHLNQPPGHPCQDYTIRSIGDAAGDENDDESCNSTDRWKV